MVWLRPWREVAEALEGKGCEWRRSWREVPLWGGEAWNKSQPKDRAILQEAEGQPRGAELETTAKAVAQAPAPAAPRAMTAQEMNNMWTSMGRPGLGSFQKGGWHQRVVCFFDYTVNLINNTEITEPP